MPLIATTFARRRSSALAGNLPTAEASLSMRAMIEASHGTPGTRHLQRVSADYLHVPRPHRLGRLFWVRKSSRAPVRLRTREPFMPKRWAKHLTCRAAGGAGAVISSHQTSAAREKLTGAFSVELRADDPSSCHVRLALAQTSGAGCRPGEGTRTGRRCARGWAKSAGAAEGLKSAAPSATMR